MLASLLSLSPWLRWPAALLALYGAHDVLAERRAAAAATEARAACELQHASAQARADAHALEKAHEIRRRMESIRPDPARVPERLRDGTFLFGAPGAADLGVSED